MHCIRHRTQSRRRGGPKPLATSTSCNHRRTRDEHRPRGVRHRSFPRCVELVLRRVESRRERGAFEDRATESVVNRPFVRCEQFLLRVYQAWSATRPPSCRYLPTCSSYAVEALQTHGFFRANRLIVARLLRCRPWGGWGADPVPSSHTHSLRSRPLREIRAHS